ncbi:MAG TPA: nuclear transport factor 2 family protein [Phycisphaerae bacterium]|nr:nuclear transport factor 2 family protein [Phycisphaerae bacterium]
MSQNTASLESELNTTIQKGEIMAAFEKYYADDVVMQENNEQPCTGKLANRAREQAFVDSVAQVHGIKVVNSAVNGDVAFSEWLLDVTFRNGQRAKMAQVAVRRWKNDRVVHERFYYNKG